jgi:hypothetical protein
MLPQAVRAMAEGHTLIFSHVAKGPVRAYCPTPSWPSYRRGIAAGTAAALRRRCRLALSGA